MITNQILKALLDNAAISEKDGLTFKEIQSCTTEDFTVKVLQSMRVDGLINNAMQKNLNAWWLTAKGADMALVDVETMQPIPEPQYDPQEVAFDQHTDAFVVEQSNDATITHCKTAQMAANLEEANDRINELLILNGELENKIMSLNAFISVLEIDVETEIIKEPVGYLLGDSIGKNPERPLQLYSENDALIAINSLEQAKTFGEQSCLESAYDFAVYALVPVGHFKSRQVVDWVGA
jgi:hypothetical protein